MHYDFTPPSKKSKGAQVKENLGLQKDLNHIRQIINEGDFKSAAVKMRILVESFLRKLSEKESISIPGSIKARKNCWNLSTSTGAYLRIRGA
ncbi:hypothetical protein RH08_02795 [Candidatus Liberibacter asiaticus]|uniref:Uncharacterized protein n=2 Tax=Liberibacter asiaticus TaxID=34021 RepID=C6XFG5_LIBAP|nr:hypothetical protein [Candidatus Liberibacter asiaticus]ACT57118.1 hypothetical protein CLIBASIA_02660 [Candidatus Liberibacter asiaticus str. psy62]AGH16917.1 hypothetical protein WSI_02735 [Candidatus Liberibacter asiaticus str. gxpsy]BAP26438.1 hypothetical protein CGUJ_02660 [Candidatus Liberibacter asiaticus str. Ishi-1]ALK07260.1 hypothetical protein CD16_02760 [Candidatus Liberibacter asiaticus]ASK52748.1 hypothetical protein B2I23_02800 [Candidatus Liberibacter asiaticus]